MMRRLLRNIVEAPLYMQLMLALAVLMLNVLIALLFGFNYLFDAILQQVKFQTNQPLEIVAACRRVRFSQQAWLSFSYWTTR